MLDAISVSVKNQIYHAKPVSVESSSRGLHTASNIQHCSLTSSCQGFPFPVTLQLIDSLRQRRKSEIRPGVPRNVLLNQVGGL